MNFMKTQLYKVMFQGEKCINSLPMQHSVIMLPHPIWEYYFCSFVFLLLEFSICVCLYIWWSPAGLLYFVHFLSFVFFLFFRQDFTWAVSLLMSLHSMCLNLLLSPPSDFFSVVIMAFLNSRISISFSHIISIFICCYLFGEASSS